MQKFIGIAADRTRDFWSTLALGIKVKLAALDAYFSAYVLANY